MNGDGRADIITANYSGSVSVLLNNGTGGFGTATSYAAGAGPFSVVAADLNGDSKPDIVVPNAFGGVSVLLNEVNIPPTITSNGRGNTACVSTVENTTAVTTVTAQDPDAGQTLTYSIDGGDDAAKFAIGAVTGKLAFLTSPDFKMPTDTKLDGFNTYHVNVKVSDGAGGTDTQAIVVRVVDGNDDKPPTDGKDHDDKGHSHGGHESKSSHGDDKPTGGKDHDDQGHSHGGHEGPDVFAFAVAFSKDTSSPTSSQSWALSSSAIRRLRTSAPSWPIPPMLAVTP